MIFFVMFTSVLILTMSKSHRMNLEIGISYFVFTFLFTLYVYMTIVHDIVSENVKTMRCCIIQCALSWQLMEILLGKEEKGKMPTHGFYVWVEEIDRRGYSSDIVYEPDCIYDDPIRLRLKSGNFDLYNDIEKLRNKHIKVQNDDEEAEEFLYGEITYVEKSKLIVGFKYLGTKRYA